MKTIISKGIKLILICMFTTSCTSPKKEVIMYSGEDLFKDVSITRDKKTKAASLRVNLGSTWSLYAGKSVDSIDLSEPILNGDKDGIYTLDIQNSCRSYFYLKTDQGATIISERHLPMTGCYNFRDLGGFQTKEGKYIKWGKVFRSDDLNKLTDTDLTYLKNIPLQSVVDFRATSEAEETPDLLPKQTLSYNLPITPGNLAAGTIDKVFNLTLEQIDTFMMDMNRSFSTDTAIIKQYTSFFKLLQDETKLPLVFHCSAGKDRTGMGAALFLYALGVDENTIMDDYFSSNVYLGDKYETYLKEYPSLKPFFEVKLKFLQAGIDQIKNDHGTVENYLENILKVDLHKMKEIYLFN